MFANRKLENDDQQTADFAGLKGALCRNVERERRARAPRGATRRGD